LIGFPTEFDCFSFLVYPSRRFASFERRSPFRIPWDIPAAQVGDRNCGASRLSGRSSGELD